MIGEIAYARRFRIRPGREHDLFPRCPWAALDPTCRHDCYRRFPNKTAVGRSETDQLAEVLSRTAAEELSRRRPVPCGH